MESSPSIDELRRAYEIHQRKRTYNAEYMRMYRKNHRKKWNTQQREMYAKRKARQGDTVVMHTVDTLDGNAHQICDTPIQLLPIS